MAPIRDYNCVLKEQIIAFMIKSRWESELDRTVLIRNGRFVRLMINYILVV